MEKYSKGQNNLEMHFKGKCSKGYNKLKAH